MKTRTILVAAAAAAFVIATAASADAKRDKRHARHAAPHAQPKSPLSFRQEPARMIEIRPGLFVSSYGCITDDGYGRYLPCDMNDGMH